MTRRRIKIAPAVSPPPPPSGRRYCPEHQPGPVPSPVEWRHPYRSINLFLVISLDVASPEGWTSIRVDFSHIKHVFRKSLMMEINLKGHLEWCWERWLQAQGITQKTEKNHPNAKRCISRKKTPRSTIGSDLVRILTAAIDENGHVGRQCNLL